MFNRGLSGLLFALFALVAVVSPSAAQTCMPGSVSVFQYRLPTTNLANRVFVFNEPALEPVLKSFVQSLNFGLTCDEAAEIKTLIGIANKANPETVFREEDISVEEFELVKKKKVSDMTGEELQAVMANDRKMLKKRVPDPTGVAPEVADARKKLAGMITARLKKQEPTVSIVTDAWNGTAILYDALKFNWKSEVCLIPDNSIFGCSNEVVVSADESMGSYILRLPVDWEPDLERWPRNWPWQPGPGPRPGPSQDQMLQMMEMMMNSQQQ